MDFLEQIRNLKEQFRTDYKFSLPDRYSNIVISGMGGSGIAGKIFQELYSDKPLFVNEDYEIPAWVGSSTLFIAISYSGNTEETLSAVKKAQAAGAHIVKISSGGKLEEIPGVQVTVPGGIQPRSALGYLLATLLNSFGMLSAARNGIYELLESIDESNGFLKEMARNIADNRLIPLILTLPGFRSTGTRWKTQFNENAKLLAFSLNFPELDHNDIMAFERSYNREKFYPIVIGDTRNKQIAKRVKVTPLLTGYRFNSLEPRGESLLERILYTIHCGDYLSYYVSASLNLDPEDVDIIERLKSELAK
ncbi:Glucose-6-phosphate isomerase [Thermoplasmatales archaeon]|nr:Glucose-6-phosphate isomerase [Thermoplasmatales archaeon]